MDIIKAFENEDLKIIKKIGQGGFGDVFEVEVKGQKRAAKLFLKGYINETKNVLEFKGQNIININQIITGKNSINYEYKLVIMEFAELNDLSYWILDLYANNKLKLIVSPPFGGEVSDNLVRYFSYGIIKGLESLDRKDYCHFDIKPENILICKRLIPKITDFSLLRNPDTIKINESDIEIPGGTNGYLTPEYYGQVTVPRDVAKKQDYFALGATIFNLKFGGMIIPGKRYKRDKITSNYIIDLIQRGIDRIKSQKLDDEDFINFLIKLINYNPEDRPQFEEIYRNKWLNKNLDNISKCYRINCIDEEKLFMELNKSDFLIHKKKQLDKNKKRKKFIFE